MNDTRILPGKMLQRYIHALAEYFYMCVFRNIITAFLVPLLGNTNPSDCAKKRQHVPNQASGEATRRVSTKAIS
jgi:hypothetical protein